MRVLLAEDDPLLGQGIVDTLTRAALTVDWVEDGPGALAALKSGGFDLLVLDLGLPRIDGLEVLRQLRAANNRIPVLILTARDRADERVRGLDAGADDYLGKPFDSAELLARLRALHRRQRGAAASAIVVGRVKLDPAAMMVTLDGRLVELPRREFALLQLLLENAGRVLTRESIVDKLYRWDEEVDSNAAQVHIHHLRKKLYPELIKTIRGVGYLVPKVAEDT
ncbi:MAG: response regulator transcription factor [Xanthomonadales bacterium]|nr:response regulator transcription factor [Xanthomonadales bacterium]